MFSRIVNNELTNQLGAGTGLPSLSLFRHLMFNNEPERFRNIQLTVTDYNPSVLQLSTIPNLLLSWATSSNLEVPSSGELEISQSLLKQFAESLKNLHINISAVSGGWGPALADLLMQQYPSQHSPSAAEPRLPCDTLILASETIYSPSSILPFVKTLLSLLQAAEEMGGRARAWIAAKKVYFGVGGGVDDFVATLTEMGGEVKVVWETEGDGVGRVILEVMWI